DRRRGEAGPPAGPPGDHPGQPLRPGRQGHGHRREVVQPGRYGYGMSGLEAMFAECREQGRAALVGYLPTGFPTVEDSARLLTALVDAGADLVEIGVPYSDPVLDGPTIQAATETALRAGSRLRDVFTVVERVASTGGRAVVMTYFNPVMRYGVEAFARDLAAAGGLGMITPA